ncbi:MAG TPA: hypothetical protein PLC43_06150 [Caldisericia bacterium]|nr:hypothetical protein [Caldisericia bacterium]
MQYLMIKRYKKFVTITNFISIFLIIILSNLVISCSTTHNKDELLTTTGVFTGMLFPLPDNSIFSQSFPELKQFTQESIMSTPDYPDYEEVKFNGEFASSNGKLYMLTRIYPKGGKPNIINAYILTFSMKIKAMTEKEIQDWNKQYTYVKKNNYNLILEKSTLFSFEGYSILGFAVDNTGRKFILANSNYIKNDEYYEKIVVLDQNDKIIDEWLDLPDYDSNYLPTIYQSYNCLFLLYPEKRIYVKPIEGKGEWKLLISDNCLSMSFCNNFLICLTRKSINLYNFNPTEMHISLKKKIPISNMKIEKMFNIKGFADEETNQITFIGEGPDIPNTPIKYFAYIYNIDANYLVELESYGSQLFEYVNAENGKKQTWYYYEKIGTIETVYDFYRLKSLNNKDSDPII